MGSDARQVLRVKYSELFNTQDWEFNKDADGEGDNFAKGGIVVSCSTCGLSTA